VTSDETVETLERLHSRFAGAVYHKCLRILGDAAEAEDAVQEVFLVAFRRLPGLHAGHGYLPSLYRISTYVCLKLLRTRQRKGFVLLDEPLPIPCEASQGQTVLARELLCRLASRLDERGQSVFVGSYVDGLRGDEIAQQLGISRRAVVKRLTAIRTLLAEIQEAGDHD
jgi:RNA polymerase sigma-70 factor, ECF subfamily